MSTHTCASSYRRHTARRTRYQSPERQLKQTICILREIVYHFICKRRFAGRFDVAMQSQNNYNFLDFWRGPHSSRYFRLVHPYLECPWRTTGDTYSRLYCHVHILKHVRSVPRARSAAGRRDPIRPDTIIVAGASRVPECRLIFFYFYFLYIWISGYLPEFVTCARRAQQCASAYARAHARGPAHACLNLAAARVHAL